MNPKYFGPFFWAFMYEAAASASLYVYPNRRLYLEFVQLLRKFVKDGLRHILFCIHCRKSIRGYAVQPQLDDMVSSDEKLLADSLLPMKYVHALRNTVNNKLHNQSLEEAIKINAQKDAQEIMSKLHVTVSDTEASKIIQQGVSDAIKHGCDSYVQHWNQNLSFEEFKERAEKWTTFIDAEQIWDLLCLIAFHYPQDTECENPNPDDFNPGEDPKVVMQQRRVVYREALLNWIPMLAIHFRSASVRSVAQFIVDRFAEFPNSVWKHGSV
jgi:hypothetical protein